MSGEPVAWIEAHKDGIGPRQLSWRQPTVSGSLNEIDQANGWTETPLYTRPDELIEAARALLEINAPDYIPSRLWDALRTALAKWDKP